MAEVTGFSKFLETMAGADAFTLLLPFILSWTVFYIALQKADFLWGDDARLQRLPPILSLFLAFFTARFIVLNPWYQTFFIDFFGRVTIGIVGVLGMFALLAFSGYTEEVISRPALATLLLLMAGASFWAAGGFGPPFAIPYVETLRAWFVWTIETGAIWLGLIGVVIWYVARPPSEGDGGRSIMDLFNLQVDDDATVDTE